MACLENCDRGSHSLSRKVKKQFGFENTPDNPPKVVSAVQIYELRLDPGIARKFVIAYVVKTDYALLSLWSAALRRNDGERRCRRTGRRLRAAVSGPLSTDLDGSFWYNLAGTGLVIFP
jgi:hypothetical protein